MKTLTGIVVLLFVVSGYSHGNEKHGAHDMSAKSKSSNHGAKGNEKTLSGTIIGLTCYIKHDSSGKSHKSCARDCAEKGLPIALKSSDGKLYVLVGDGHDSLIETYKPLLKYLESKVKIKGEVFEKEGQRMLVVKKIKKV